jgi:hypothetical protein
MTAALLISENLAYSRHSVPDDIARTALSNAAHEGSIGVALDHGLALARTG